MSGVDLERSVGDALRRLPGPTAPPTLLPRVMAAVQAWTMRPWYQRAWFTWPRRGQVAAAAAALLVAVGLAWLLAPYAVAGQQALASAVSRASTVAPDLAPRVQAAILAARVLWGALVHPVLVYAFAIVALMSAACVAIALALDRAVFGKVFS